MLHEACGQLERQLNPLSLFFGGVGGLKEGEEGQKGKTREFQGL